MRRLRDQAGNRAAALGDDDLLAVLLDFIEQFKAFDFEQASGYFLLHGYDYIAISSYRSLAVAARKKRGYMAWSCTYRATCSCVANQTPDLDFMWAMK